MVDTYINTDHLVASLHFIHSSIFFFFFFLSQRFLIGLRPKRAEACPLERFGFPWLDKYHPPYILADLQLAHRPPPPPSPSSIASSEEIRSIRSGDPDRREHPPRTSFDEFQRLYYLSISQFGGIRITAERCLLSIKTNPQISIEDLPSWNVGARPLEFKLSCRDPDRDRGGGLPN